MRVGRIPHKAFVALPQVLNASAREGKLFILLDEDDARAWIMPCRFWAALCAFVGLSHLEGAQRDHFTF